MPGFSYESNITTESNSRIFSNSSPVFGIDDNDKKYITSNKTHLTIAISDHIISEGIYFNLAQKRILMDGGFNGNRWFNM